MIEIMRLYIHNYRKTSKCTNTPPLIPVKAPITFFSILLPCHMI